ncbi:50S ribosomal protein L13 [Arcticibacterium luteifluviistationis]|uniref:Large ribosomal subunit protein uL13 n=1 Tax=Arcticibacterium luteifluviistationis TaxID=1784714 RepID=A0A2Z4GFI5_9BACT|nr:50S ribosomal protein L13 [Arcticibacterium luteifluviistationis]AWV99815.1 50S ribosomal protein L13 [Arcticibacterium luteifluviistationis]
MDTLSYKTVSANKATVNKEWIIVDVKDQVLGRVCSQIASILKGKNKTNYTPHVDCGDNVIVINAEKVKLTGKKMTDKQYIRHTGHPGGQRFATPRELMEKDGRRVVEMAVRGMLPKTRLGRKQFTNLFVYVGTEHPHSAQQAKLIEL